MDDFIVHGNTFEGALHNIEKVLVRCETYNLSLSYEKYFMIMQEGIILGHHISYKGIKVDPKKVDIIKQLLTLENQANVRSFLGHAGYYRRFISNFRKIVAPLFSLLHKDNEFERITDYEKVFQKIKEKLMTTLVLRGPN